MNAVPQFVSGSFRDREGSVFTVGRRIFRTLSHEARNRFQDLEKDGRLKQLVDSGQMVSSFLTSAVEADLDPKIYGEIVMEHERLPLITYPYEWSFDMLRDAALLTLDLLESCLNMNLILKDGTPFNLTIHKNRMMFFDALSLDLYEEGRPWEGYSQFCREFLFPLMLTSYKGIEFQPWFRGSLNGIPVSTMSRIFGYLEAPFKGVFSHVHLQAMLEKYLAGKDVDVRKRFNGRGIPKKVLLKMVKKLRRLIENMKYDTSHSAWAHYERQNTYTPEEEQTKTNFIGTIMRKPSLSQWVDLGCNGGKYSSLFAPHAKTVVGLEADPSAVNAFYRRFRETSDGSFYPMVCDLLNPSPALGWGLVERPSLFERVQGGGFLALALIHHVCIANNVPLTNFLELLKRFGTAGVIEWVDKSDPMVQRMLRNRRDIFTDYTWENFKSLLEKTFSLSDVVETHNGTRKLCSIAARR